MEFEVTATHDEFGRVHIARGNFVPDGHTLIYTTGVNDCPTCGLPNPGRNPFCFCKPNHPAPVRTLNISIRYHLAATDTKPPER